LEHVRVLGEDAEVVFGECAGHGGGVLGGAPALDEPHGDRDPRLIHVEHDLFRYIDWRTRRRLALRHVARPRHCGLEYQEPGEDAGQHGWKSLGHGGPFRPVGRDRIIIRSAAFSVKWRNATSEKDRRPDPVGALV